MRHLEYPDIPFHGLLRRAAGLWPDKPAIVFEGTRLTFREWDEQVGRLAAALQRLGVEPDDRVALFLPNCPEYEIAFFACNLAGAIPTPLNPSYRGREVRDQVADAGAVALVVHASLLPILNSVRGEIPSVVHTVVVGDGDDAGAVRWPDLLQTGESVRDVSRGPDDLAALPYSSGTTGVSKGVMLSHRNLVCNALQFVDATRSTVDDVILIFLPLYHIYGVALMATALASGSTQILMPRFDLARVLEHVERDGVTELYVVPPVMLALADAPDLAPERFQHVRFLMSAAAPLAPEVARRVAERLDVTVIQAYGMTESSPLTHMVPLEGGLDLLGSVGMPAADTRCRIVDADTGEHVLGPGELGEIAVQGPQVMHGYWNAPEESARALRDGWLYTGDIGSVDDANNLYVVDRKKEMIKYKAFSIAPAELEALLVEHPAVLDCAVVGKPDDEAGEVPVAFVVQRPGMAVTPKDLQQFVAGQVAGYKQLREIRIVDDVPRTPSGKILRRTLREQVRAL